MTEEKEDILNPKRKFRSPEELANYAKTEWTDEKIMKALRETDMVVNVDDPRIAHNVIIKELAKIQTNSFEQKRYVTLVKMKTVVATMNKVRNIPFGPGDITVFLAKFFDMSPEALREVEVRAIDFCKNHFAKKKASKISEIIY